MEATLAVVKPDAVASGHVQAIKDRILAAGLTILAERRVQVSREEAAEFYGEHEGKPFFEGLLDFMVSGPVHAMKLEGENAIAAWRSLMGPTKSEEARETAPESLRALFGTDNTRNATHGSDSTESASREIEFYFGERPNGTDVDGQDEPEEAAGAGNEEREQDPGTAASPEEREVESHAESIESHATEEGNGSSERQHAQADHTEGGPSIFELSTAFQSFVPVKGKARKAKSGDSLTCAIIKPDAIHRASDILELAFDAGFRIVLQRQLVFTAVEAQHFCAPHRGQHYHEDIVDHLSSGESMVLCLAGQNAVARWRQLIGPTNPEMAVDLHPTSIRAKFGTNSVKNAVHGSDSRSSARRELQILFPGESEAIAEAIVGAELESVLTEGLVALARAQPDSPLQWLGNWLLKNNPNSPSDPTIHR